MYAPSPNHVIMLTAQSA